MHAVDPRPTLAIATLAEDTAPTAVAPVPRADGATTRRLPSVSVVIPTLNEAENLPYVLERLPPWISEVVIVDGHSSDDTIEVALRHRPDAKIVMQDGKGKGNALSCGFKAATCDITVMLDGDGSTDPGDPPVRRRPDQWLRLRQVVFRAVPSNSSLKMRVAPPLEPTGSTAAVAEEGDATSDAVEPATATLTATMPRRIRAWSARFAIEATSEPVDIYL